MSYDVNKIKRLLTKRYYQLCNRSTAVNVREPSLNLLEMLLQRVLAEGLICHYCGCDLDLYPSPSNYKKTLSLDHKIPFSEKVDNSIDNLIICCTRCNFAKGTTAYKVFKERVDSLKWTNRALMESFLDDSFERNRKNSFQNSSNKSVEKF